MTTGNWHEGSLSYAASGTSKFWSGQDGKFTTISGRRSIKWNNYSMEFLKQTQKASLSNGYVFDNVVTPATLTPFWTSNTQLVLLSKLSDQIRGHSFNLAVNAAQGKELVNMVVLNLSKFSRSIMALKHGDFATAARQLGANAKTSRLSPKDISGRWLELQYGWLPSLSDTYEAAKAFEVLTKNYRVCTVTAKHSIRGTYERVNGGTNGIGPYKISKRIIGELYEDLSTSRSLGLLDPLSVAWEIIPYSFVVDWFIPIGTYLDNLSILGNVKGRFLESMRVSYQSHQILRGPYVGVPSFMAARCTTQTEALYRGSAGSLSVPRPSIESFPDAMKPKRIWNAIALAAQRFK